MGILRPTAGPLLDEGAAMVEAALLAVDEVNARGGIRGRRVEPVFLDTGDELGPLPRATWRHLEREQGAVLLGGLTAQVRETIRRSLPFKENNDLLIYPGPADGVAGSEHVVSPRPTPPQSVLPVVDWLCRERGKKRLYVIAADSFYPRVAVEMLRQYLRENQDSLPDVELADPVFLPEDKVETKALVDAIPKGEDEPDVILNLLHDAATADLLEEVHKADFRPRNTPVVTLRFGVAVLRHVADAKATVAGQYLVGNYFLDLPGDANARFRQGLRAKYGDPRQAGDSDDTAVAAYVGVHLWARAAGQAGTDDPAEVRAKLRGQSFHGPAGLVRLDAAPTGYSRTVVRVARVVKDHSLCVLREWREPGDPAPCYGHPKQYWNFLQGYWVRNWSERLPSARWFNPGGKTRILPLDPDEPEGQVR
jgi:urea transport system substrate-binding protein